ncbi:DinB family protein [Algoriphagus boseongensis]|uniref:DinB family protein n=2 Tax=Algoriphagus boseongensis TaxID=1442587 RepID=A0A4R6T4X1_9BACT|nr:DinB family protein [Algoriphagus boseongensis]
MLEQNKLTCSFAFEKINQENSTWRLNPKTASIGFIFRHIGETMNLFGYFFGFSPSTSNTTMGKEDKGDWYEVAESRMLIEVGFQMLEQLVKNTAEEDWTTIIETPFFGPVSKMRLFSHILFHNAHHAGQLSLTLSRGA